MSDIVMYHQLTIQASLSELPTIHPGLLFCQRDYRIPAMKSISVAIAFSLATLALCPWSFPQTAAPMQPGEFDHQAIHVRDLQKSAAFYESVLGLKRMPDPFKDGRHVWFRIGAHDQLHVIGGATEVAKQDIDVHMSFRVPSLADFVNRLDQLGVKYVNSKGEEKKITVRPDGVKQVYFQDPDGYWIEVNDDKF
jgi:lactoylglutathione lyase